VVVKIHFGFGRFVKDQHDGGLFKISTTNEPKQKEKKERKRQVLVTLERMHRYGNH